MKKTLLGLIAALLIAAGGYFGFLAYVQHRVTAEVDAAFERIRSDGGKASHGKLSYDLWNRTLTIADIASESATQPPVTAKIANLTASGVSSSGDNRFSAELVEVSDFEASMNLAAPAVGRTTYRVPRIFVRELSGPSRLQRPAAGAVSSPLDVYRSLVTQFADVSAASISAPTVTAKMDATSAAPDGAEFVYSNLSLEGIKGGKIASIRADEAKLMMSTRQAGKSDKLTGRIAGFTTVDFDTNTIALLLDPQKAKADDVYRVYRQVSIGAYEIGSTKGLRMRIDGVTINDVGVRPALVQLPDFLALMPQPGTAASSAQGRAMMERTAKLYEGLSIGNTEMRGLSIETPQGPTRLAALQFNLDKGKSDFAFEGLEGRAPQGPVKVGRFALKSIDVANLMRISTHFSNPAQPPSPDRALEMIPLIAGVEIKGLVAPFKNTGKPVRIESFGLDWGQFVGPIPTKVRLTTKISTPFDDADPKLKPLIAAGIDTAAIDNDFGAAWTEANKTFTLDPVSLDIGGLLKANARLSLTNVPRGVFTLNPLQAAAMAEQIEAGGFELVLQDMGAVDIVVAQYARTHDLGREAARSAILDGIRAGREKAAANPDALSALEAVTRFVETPGQTLILKLTPLGKVKVKQVLDLLKTDPSIALAQFRIEASTGL